MWCYMWLLFFFISQIKIINQNLMFNIRKSSKVRNKIYSNSNRPNLSSGYIGTTAVRRNVRRMFIMFWKYPCKPYRCNGVRYTDGIESVNKQFHPTTPVYYTRCYGIVVTINYATKKKKFKLKTLQKTIVYVNRNIIYTLGVLAIIDTQGENKVKQTKPPKTPVILPQIVIFVRRKQIVLVLLLFRTQYYVGTLVVQAKNVQYVSNRWILCFRLVDFFFFKLILYIL